MARTRASAPAFNTDRIIHMSSMSESDKDKLYDFLVAQKMNFWKDSDGSYVANVRMYDKRAAEAFEKEQEADAKALSASWRAGAADGRGAEDADVSAMMGSLSMGTAPFDTSSYPRFVGLITGKEALKPKSRPLAWVMRVIEEIYDNRYARDTADLRDGTDGAPAPEKEPSVFPTFVVEFFSKRYGLRTLVEQTSWDLLYNVHTMRNDYLEVEVFARFLEEYYDPEDLLFFLYVRSVVQQELNLGFRSRWTDVGRNRQRTPTTVFLSQRDCQQVSRAVFGSESDPLYKAFMAMMDRHLMGTHRTKPENRKIEVTQFLHLALVEYHAQRPSDGADGGAGAGTGAGAGAAGSSAADRDALFREAEKDFASRTAASDAGPSSGAAAAVGTTPDEGAIRRALAAQDAASPSASLGLPSSAPPPASPSAGTPAAAVGAGPSTEPALKRKMLEELGDCMHRSNEAFLDSQMAACSGLPANVVAQIRAEVKQQLEARVDSVLGAIINASRGRAAVDPSLAPLAKQFQAVLEATDPAASGMDKFCQELLKTPEIQSEITPLVSLLATYATSRLKEFTSKPASGGADPGPPAAAAPPPPPTSSA